MPLPFTKNTRAVASFDPVTEKEKMFRKSRNKKIETKSTKRYEHPPENTAYLLRKTPPLPALPDTAIGMLLSSPIAKKKRRLARDEVARVRNPRHAVPHKQKQGKHPPSPPFPKPKQKLQQNSLWRPTRWLVSSAYAGHVTSSCRLTYAAAATAELSGATPFPSLPAKERKKQQPLALTCDEVTRVRRPRQTRHIVLQASVRAQQRKGSYLVPSPGGAPDLHLLARPRRDIPVVRAEADRADLRYFDKGRELGWGGGGG